MRPAPAKPAPSFRPPAVPLIVHDPYFSIWSLADRLTDDHTRHWTGATQPLVGLVRIDGKCHRFMGRAPRDVPAMEQTSVQVLPTRTIYQFRAAGVELMLTFLTPALPHDLDILSRPVTYLVWTARSADGRPHRVTIYLEVSAALAVHDPAEQVTCSRFRLGNLEVLAAASRDQRVLDQAGDNLRIDWGSLYLVVPPSPGAEEQNPHPGPNPGVPRKGEGADPAGRIQAIARAAAARESFLASGTLPLDDELEFPRPASDESGGPVLACVLDMGVVGGTRAGGKIRGREQIPEEVTRYALLAYDDRFSIEYLHQRLRPYWRRTGWGAAELLRAALKGYPALARRCAAFDRELMADLRRVGGERYALLAALAFRQCLAAHKLVAGADGEPLLFSKENFSNGCIGTVDVTYPSAPFFLLFNPALLEAQLAPVMEYAALPRWRFPFAPHDLGTYPLANGQVYGGGETSERNQMPVEESGNMLLLVAALAQAQGHADFAARYWPLLRRWAGYLRRKGMNPAHQLCTDDFAGHLAGNTNLSIKATLAQAAYGRLCGMLGKKAEARAATRAAKTMARRWMKMADDGDHYRLAFDKPGSWSQKYNLVWDRLLGLGIFPRRAAAREVAFYLKKQNLFGLPLDNRRDYTKLDWTMWTAMLAGDRADFDALIAPLGRWADQTLSRVPLTDWFDTRTGRQEGFQARSVVGGVFIPLLGDAALREKWRRRVRVAR